MEFNNNDGILRVGRVSNQQGQQVIINGLGQWRCCVCGHRAGYADCVEHVFHVHVSEISREERVNARLLAEQLIKRKEEVSKSRLTECGVIWDCNCCKFEASNEGVIVHYRGIHYKSRGMFECGLCEKAWTFRAGSYTTHLKLCLNADETDEPSQETRDRISSSAELQTHWSGSGSSLISREDQSSINAALKHPRLSPNVTTRVSKDNRISKPLNNHRSQFRQQQLPVSRIQTTQISRDCAGNTLQHQFDSPQPWPFPFSPHTINSNFSQPATPSDSLPTSLASTSRFSRRHEESGIHSSYAQLATYPSPERIPFSPLPRSESSICSAHPHPHPQQHQPDSHPPSMSSSSIPSTPAWNYRPMSRRSSNTGTFASPSSSVTTPERYQPPLSQVWEMPELPGPYSY